MISRRSVLALAAGSAILRGAGKRIPLGLEMYSVRGTYSKDPESNIREAAKMGFVNIEIYGSYIDSPSEKIKGVRSLLDELKITCLSTHNDAKAFADDGMQKAIDQNSILGARYIVMASGGAKDMDGWKRVSDTLTKASERFASANLRAGYHNHDKEFRPLDGTRPEEIIAANTPKNVMLQLDVGHCIEGGGDPVAFMEAHPGRFQSLHLKEWSPEKKFEAVMGEGLVPWRKVFDAAEKTGGVEYYLIEWEGTASPAFESVGKCLAEYKKIHG